MLNDFLGQNRDAIIARCRSRVAARMAPRPTALELEQGIPLFLDQLATAVRSKLANTAAVTAGASKHGGDMLRMGFTIAQVVYDYGDVCQTITELVIEQQAATIPTEEYQLLNMCLDEAIAGAVTEYARQRQVDIEDADNKRATEDLGYLAHELRNLIATATLAFESLRGGGVGVAGSTGAVLGRSLMRLGNLVDRSLSAVRLKAGISSSDQFPIGELIEEVEASALMEAKAAGHQFTIETIDREAVVKADRQILASIVANLVQNALKYTRPHSHVTVRTGATAELVRIEVEDECGGLPPGRSETLLQPFKQASADHTGLGLGLAICVRGAKAIGGELRIRDLPGKGCVFAVELPRVQAAR